MIGDYKRLKPLIENSQLLTLSHLFSKCSRRLMFIRISKWRFQSISQFSVIFKLIYQNGVPFQIQIPNLSNVPSNKHNLTFFFASLPVSRILRLSNYFDSSATFPFVVDSSSPKTCFNWWIISLYRISQCIFLFWINRDEFTSCK